MKQTNEARLKAIKRQETEIAKSRQKPNTKKNAEPGEEQRRLKKLLGEEGLREQRKIHAAIEMKKQNEMEKGQNTRKRLADKPESSDWSLDEDELASTNDSSDLFFLLSDEDDEEDDEEDVLAKMDVARVKNPLREKQHKFDEIQLLIKSRENMLLEKQGQLKANSKDNQLLQTVRDDYAKLNAYIVEQKSDQIKALNTLDNYIKELIETGGLSPQNIEDAKQEQKKILRELATINKTLDSILKKF